MQMTYLVLYHLSFSIMSQCIICLKDHRVATVEHIVPRSLGNIHYVLPKGKVCSPCNNRFARYENAVLNSATWLKWRQEYGVAKPNLTPHKVEPTTLDLRQFYMKLCYESVYYSRPALLNQYDLTSLRQELSIGIEADCDIVRDKVLDSAKHLPQWINRWRLRNNHIYLRYKVLHGQFYFEFRYGPLSNVLIVNLNK